MGSRWSKAIAEEEWNRDLYDRLHVSREASAEQIREAFVYWSGVARPDMSQDAAEENFRQINEAYEILGSEAKRQIYDIYGIEGINSGLELVPHLNEVAKLKEALEKSKRPKEQEEVLPHDLAFTTFLADLSLPEYIDGGGIMRRIQVYTEHQSHVSKCNTISINGNLVVSGEEGNGSAKLVFRHQMSPVTQVDFIGAEDLQSHSHIASLETSRQLSHNSTATTGLTYHVGDRSFSLSNSWTHQLSETSFGDIQLVLGTKSAITVGWKRKEEKTSAAGEVKFGMSSIGASAHCTHYFSQKSHCRVAGNIGRMDRCSTCRDIAGCMYLGGCTCGPYCGFELEIGGGRRISDYISVQMLYKIGIQGVSWKFELQNGSKKFLIPVLLSCDLNPIFATGALMIPLSLYFLVKKLVLRPYYFRQKRQEAVVKKNGSLNQIRKARDAAKKAQQLLRNVFKRNKNDEVDDALIITKAMYGNLRAARGIDEHLEVNDNAVSPVLDVTLPLNFLVCNSQLELHEGVKKSGLMGFCDPCPGEVKQLLVEYTFNGQKYKVVVDDYDLLRIPQNVHKI